MRQGATRRTVVTTGAVALAGACIGCGGDSGGSGGGGSDGEELAKTSDIPEGGGKIFTDRKVVVTQPKKGDFKAFSAVCTHMGCTVATVADGTIDCPCHGSKFRIADGAVAQGPATKPLPPETITVKGNSIRLA
ncbi:Rieske (2Fe-2S) protein [Streptomyces sp. NPDC047028]|uniref:Rieske (2Fe-2S) protein n=1 Tax=Streptomyces sp. NPDC047028 TaxID=3155793 RepID=UPI0034115849